MLLVNLTCIYTNVLLFKVYSKLAILFNKLFHPRNVRPNRGLSRSVTGLPSLL